MITTRDKYIGKYRAARLASAATLSSTEYFDLLGHPARPIDPLAAIRRAEGIDTALRYTKASRGPVHAYWIEAAPGHEQTIHFIVDGNDAVYSLVGTITPRLYQSILANLRVVAQP